MYTYIYMCVRAHWSGNLRTRDHLGDTDTDGMITLKEVLEEKRNGLGRCEWIHLVQDGGKWWVLETFGFHKRWGISRLAESLLAFEEDSASCSLV